MAKLLKLRRGTTTQHGSFTGAEGEVTVDTDKETLVVHDGSTAGGHPVAAEDMANVSSASIAGRLANDSIATSKIAAGALPSDVTVASANIVNGTIATDDIGGQQITTAKIADDAVTAAKIAAGAVGQTEIATGGVDATELAADAVRAVKIQDGAVISSKIAADAVNGTKIADDSINSEHYVDGSIDTAHIADDAVTTAKIANSAVNVNKIADNAITSAKILNGAIVNGDINANAAIAGTKISPDFGSQNVDTTGNILLDSNSNKLKIGDGEELQISHNGSNSVITDTAHPVFVKGNQVHLQSANGNMFSGYQDAQVELFHNENKRLETTTSGITVSSNVNCGNVYCSNQIGLDSTDHITFTNNTRMDVTINGSNEFRFESDGDFHADGDVIAQSTTISSDAKLKEDIELVPDALSKLNKLNGVTFKWKRSNEKSAGVIAQDVQKVLPEAVKEVTALSNGETHLSVNYHALTSILIEAVKELQAEVEKLKGGK